MAGQVPAVTCDGPAAAWVRLGATMTQRPAIAPLGLVAPSADTAADERQRRLQWAVWSSGKTLWEWQAQHGGFLVEHRQRAGDGIAPAGDLPDVVVRTEHLDWDAFVARLHPQDRAGFQLAWRQHLAGQRPDIDLTLRAAESDPTAAPRWWRLRGRALGRDATGQVARVLGTLKDVSAERGAQVSVRRLAHAFASTREALALVDADGTVLEANAALQRLCGSAPLTLGNPLPTWLDDATPLPALLAEVLFLGAWQGERVWRGAAGPVPVAVSITPVDAADGEPPCFLVALTDQRERLAAQQRLLHTAMTDQVTLLPNRLAAEAKGEALFSQPGPLPPEVALLFIDLDGFKDLNESYGHAFGDALLAEVGHRLRLALGETATLARWNADVFAVLLPPGSGDTDVRAAAQLALAALAEPLQVQSQALTVVATLGAALGPQHGSDFNTLVRKAELAVHAAKDTGRNFVVFEPELDDAVQRRVRMTGLLRIDADRNAFHFVAQPKVDADGLPVGVELLMRWTTEAFGAVSPVEFIPLAERVGLIQMMGRHAAQAAAQLAAASVAAGHHLPVAVNLAALQLQQPGHGRLAGAPPPAALPKCPHSARAAAGPG